MYFNEKKYFLLPIMLNPLAYAQQSLRCAVQTSRASWKKANRDGNYIRYLGIFLLTRQKKKQFEMHVLQNDSDRKTQLRRMQIFSIAMGNDMPANKQQAASLTISIYLHVQFTYSPNSN